MPELTHFPFFPADTVSSQTSVLHTGLFLKLFFPKSGGVHDKLHICVGSGPVACPHSPSPDCIQR